MPETSLTIARQLSDDYITEAMRETVPNWLLTCGDALLERVWEMPFRDLSEAAYDIFENEFGKGFASKRIHLAFWSEFERAVSTRSRFQFVNVIGGVCSVKALQNLCSTRQEVVAWLLTPPVTYQNKLLELSISGEERMMEILNASPVLPNGKVDSKLALAQIKLWEILQDRLHGAVAQNINQKSVNVNVNQNSSAATGVPADLTPAQIMDRLSAIKQRVEQLTSPAPIRVDATKMVQPNKANKDE